MSLPIGHPTGNVPQSAMEAALAILSDAPSAPQPAAPQAPPQPAVDERQQPEQGRERDERGRFRPQAAPPAAPAAQPQPQGEQPAPPQTPAVDWEAEARRQAQEVQRLRNSYQGNLSQKDAAIEAARKEADAARAEAKALREKQLADWKEGIQLMPPGADRERAVEAYLAEREKDQDQARQQWEDQRKAEQESQQQTTAQRTDLAQRAGLWGVVEGYVYSKAQELGWDQSEANEVIEGLKTPELAAAFLHLPFKELQQVVMARGDALSRDIARRAEQRLDRNRQAAITSGAHQHEQAGQAQPAPRPTDRFVRGQQGVRPGIHNARAMAAALLEEEN
jgi:hypothetical protein